MLNRCGCGLDMNRLIVLPEGSVSVGKALMTPVLFDL